MQLGRGSGICVVVLLVLMVAAWIPRQGLHADSRQPRMGIFTKPDALVDLTLKFVDSSGETGALKEFIPPGRPFILVPIFYNCPRLCGLTLSGVVDLINQLPLSLETDYSVVFYSFNPDDTTRDAEAKKAVLFSRMTNSSAPQSAVRFLTANSATIEAINDQLGFRIRYADKELEHSSAIFILSGNGSVRRYFAGVEFTPAGVAKSLKG